MKIYVRSTPNTTIECDSKKARSHVNESYKFILLPSFVKDAKKLKLTDDDIEDLKHAIATQPPEASLGSGVYKFRWSPKSSNQSKRKSTRVVYIDVIKESEVYLVAIYPKNAKSTLSPDELKSIRQIAKAISNGGELNGK